MNLRFAVVSALAISSFLPAPAAASEATVYRPGVRRAQTTQVVVRHRHVRRRRAHLKRNSALRIGGGAAAGAAIGALAGGGKGAAIGGIAGGGAGALYDQHERNKRR